MKEGWKVERLDKLCVIKDKFRKPITKSKRESGPYPYYGATGLLDYVKDFIFDEKLVLLGEDGAKWGAGEISAYSINGKTWVNNHAHVLAPKDNLLEEWLIYYLNFADLSDYITGVTVPKLNQEKMSSIQIPLPPLPEQQRIVEYLDSTFAEIDALKAKAAEEVANAKAMFDAALREEMTPKEGWEEKRLKEIAKYSIGLTYKPSDVSEYGTIVLRSANIQDDKLDLTDLVRVNCKIKDSLYVDENDILMCSRNGSARLVGKVALLPNMKEKMTYGTFMMVIKSEYNDYLFYFFKSDIFRNQIKHGEANMINQITRYMLDEVYVGLPSIEIQQRIVARLDTLRALVTSLEQKYAKIAAECDALKQAILRETFE